MLDALREELKPWGFNRQEISGKKVSSLVQQIQDGIYKTKKLKLSLEVFDLSAYSFATEDLQDFLLHCIMINEASLEYPVIINSKGHVIDGRHRICKAILMGLKEIDAIMILDDPIIGT